MTSTTNYEQFKLLRYNRDLNRKHINSLKESITSKGYLKEMPILVNEEFEIIDGQHRFIACKETGTPIEYAVVKNADDLITLINANQKGWTTADYVKMHAEKDLNQNYKRLHRLSKELGLPITSILSMGYGNIQNGGETFKNLKEGKTKFTLDHELRAISFASNMNKLLSFVPRLRMNTRLSQALLLLQDCSSFRWETLLSKAEKYPTVAYPCRTKEEFVEMLVGLYNHGTKVSTKKISVGK